MGLRGHRVRHHSAVTGQMPTLEGVAGLTSGHAVLPGGGLQATGEEMRRLDVIHGQSLHGLARRSHKATVLARVLITSKEHAASNPARLVILQFDMILHHQDDGGSYIKTLRAVALPRLLSERLATSMFTARQGAGQMRDSLLDGDEAARPRSSINYECLVDYLE